MSPQAEQVLRRSHGHRPNKAKLLEAAAADLAEQIRTLAKQNALLRAKEAMQFEILKNYEESLHHMGTLLSGLPDNNNEAYEGAVMTAAMLDFRAVELMQQLCASSSTPQPSSKSGSASSQSPSSKPQLTASLQQEQSCGTSQASAEGNASTGPDSGCDAAIVRRQAATLDRKTAHMWLSVTPEAVVAMQGASVQGIAERIKDAAARIALMSHCTSDNTKGISPGVVAAVQEYGVIVMLAMVAADARFLEVTCLNLETMQPETPPENLWKTVTQKAELSAAQRLQVYLAFECNRDQRTALLQEQDSLVKQLQALLGGAPSPTVADMAAAQQQAHAAAQAEPSAQRCGHTTSTPYIKASSRSSVDASSEVNTLDLEAAEQAEALLCRLARNIQLQREYSRRLVYLWMDLLSEEQHAEGILAAYPFTIKTPAVCAHIWQQEADKRKASPIKKSDTAH